MDLAKATCLDPRGLAVPTLAVSAAGAVAAISAAAAFYLAIN
jgi:hypothetical protein